MTGTRKGLIDDQLYQPAPADTKPTPTAAAAQIRSARLHLLADSLTALRLVFGVCFVLIGLYSGAAAFGLVVFLLIIGWVGDTVDGHIAKMAGGEGTTWLGRHDVLVDTVFCAGSLLYFAISGMITWALTMTYFIAAGLFLYFWPHRSAIIIVEAPVALLPIPLAWQYAPQLLWVLAACALSALILDRHRFLWRLRRFLNGFREFKERR